MSMSEPTSRHLLIARIKDSFPDLTDISYNDIPKIYDILTGFNLTHNTNLSMRFQIHIDDDEIKVDKAEIKDPNPHLDANPHLDPESWLNRQSSLAGNQPFTNEPYNSQFVDARPVAAQISSLQERRDQLESVRDARPHENSETD